MYSSTRIGLVWDAIKDNQANGILLGYNVSLTWRDKIDNQLHIRNTTVQPIGGSPMLLLDDLQSHTKYSFKVCGFTSKGCGPWSKEMTKSTISDGMLNWICHLSFYWCVILVIIETKYWNCSPLTTHIQSHSVLTKELFEHGNIWSSWCHACHQLTSSLMSTSLSISFTSSNPLIAIHAISMIHYQTFVKRQSDALKHQLWYPLG